MRGHLLVPMSLANTNSAANDPSAVRHSTPKSIGRVPFLIFPYNPQVKKSFLNMNGRHPLPVQ